ncbi:MAG: PQQ-binding-like beta-propeller repeat protein [Rhodobiaceae bacterium]|nr:PQQ-binding-like beta-propeller repeat protein [Rhodobiaceae bacterium]
MSSIRSRHGAARLGRAASLAAAAGLGLFALAGCSTLSMDSLSLDKLNPFREREEILPGTRVDAMTEADPLTVDADAARRGAAVPAARDSAEWSQPGGVASNAPGNLALASGTAGWRVKAASGSSKKSRLSVSPIVYQGNVYVMDAGADVTAVSVTGARRWEVSLRPAFEKDDGVIGGGLAGADGRVFAATGFGSLVALDPASGGQQWRVELKVPIRSAPTIAEGRIFLVTADNRIHALSTADGSELWTYRGIPETTGLVANASPAVSGDIVVVPYSSGEVIAFKASSGEPVWADSLTRTQLFTSLSGINEVAARPVVDDNTVFAVSVSGRMVAVNRKTGERLWTRNIASTQTPMVAGETVFVVSVSGQLVALERSSGKVRWTTKLPGDAKTRWHGPVLGGGQLWLSSSTRKLVSVDAASGQVSGTQEIGHASFISPIIASGRLFLLLDDGTLAAI